MRARSLCTLALAMTTMAAACGSSSSGTGTGGTSGGGHAGTGTGTGGTSAAGTAGTTGTGGTGTGTGGTGTGTGGSTATGTAGTTGGGGGGATGTAGTSGGGVSGTAGTSGGGVSGTAGTSGGGRGGSTAGTGGGGTGGATASACPTNATFCSGFETAGLPSGAIYAVNAAPGDFSRDFAIDTTQHHAGASSLRVKASSESGTSGSAYRMLAVPATAGAFWARFWVQSSIVMGGVDHNAFAGGSIGSMPNDMKVEFAEDVGIAFNTSDSDVWPTGYGRLTGGGTNPYTLPAMTWACVELSFNGSGHVQQLYIFSTELINATNYPTAAIAFTYFKFGFESFHGPDRVMWYDDVAVTPTRIPGGGCPTS
jgi:hypothetical protein